MKPFSSRASNGVSLNGRNLNGRNLDGRRQGERAKGGRSVISIKLPPSAQPGRICMKCR